jgi:hypothetical protein
VKEAACSQGNVQTESIHKSNAAWYLFAIPTQTPQHIKARLAHNGPKHPSCLSLLPHHSPTLRSKLQPVLTSSHWPSSLVLWHAARRRTVTIPTMHHNGGLSASFLHLLLYVGAVLDVLPEVADVAANLLVGLE